MITRNRLGILAVTTIVLLGLSSLTRNLHHGIGGAAGFLFWWSFVISAVIVVVSSATILIRHTGRQTR